MSEDINNDQRPKPTMNLSNDSCRIIPLLQ
jgi:hypothetical protein